MFHTLRYAKILEEAGFSREQSETSVKLLVEVMETSESKTDKKFELLIDSINDRFDLVDTRFDSIEEKFATKQDIRQDISDLRHEIHAVESRMTIRMGSMLAASIAILTAIQKLL